MKTNIIDENVIKALEASLNELREEYSTNAVKRLERAIESLRMHNEKTRKHLISKEAVFDMLSEKIKRIEIGSDTLSRFDSIRIDSFISVKVAVASMPEEQNDS